ncbi:MAG TPA: hypothetical protein VF135_00365 [Terriglobales bacterium]
MESAVTVVMLMGVLLFSVATAVLVEELIFGGLSRVVLTQMGRDKAK